MSWSIKQLWRIASAALLVFAAFFWEDQSLYGALMASAGFSLGRSLEASEKDSS